MNPAQLRAFHAVASKGSFTAAARALIAAQPTLSSQIKALEQNYGIRLFDRVRRGVVLTELGTRLHEVTRRRYSLEEKAGEILTVARQHSSGNLRLDSDGPYHVVPIVAEFKRGYPQPDLSLDVGIDDRGPRDLRESHIDLAVLARNDDDPRL